MLEEEYVSLLVLGKVVKFQEILTIKICFFVKQLLKTKATTLPETSLAHENLIFPGKYHQNCGFSMAMLVAIIYENSNRVLEHDPGTQNTHIWKDFFHKQVVEGVPGACWSFRKHC